MMVSVRGCSDCMGVITQRLEKCSSSGPGLTGGQHKMPMFSAVDCQGPGYRISEVRINLVEAVPLRPPPQQPCATQVEDQWCDKVPWGGGARGEPTAGQRLAH